MWGFFILCDPPLVPDLFLSLDAQIPERWYEKGKRSYFVWEFGKWPEVVVEIVSNKKGNELGSKMRAYSRIRIPYYIVYDPIEQLSDEPLQVFMLQGGEYKPLESRTLASVGLGVTLWSGVFEAKEAMWLRWCDIGANLIPTGAERAARQAAKLREMGINPDEI